MLLSLRFVFPVFLIFLSIGSSTALSEDFFSCSAPFGKRSGSPSGSHVHVLAGKDTNLCRDILVGKSISKIHCSSKRWPPTIDDGAYFRCELGSDCGNGGTFTKLQQNVKSDGSSELCATYSNRGSDEHSITLSMSY